MAVSERAQVPTPAQRRAAALDRSRYNLTVLTLVLGVGAFVLLAMAMSSGSWSSENGAGTPWTGVLLTFAVFSVAFSAASASAAFVLSALRDAALEEG